MEGKASPILTYLTPKPLDAEGSWKAWVMTVEWVIIQNQQEIPFLLFLLYIRELNKATLICMTLGCHVCFFSTSLYLSANRQLTFVVVPILAKSWLWKQVANSLKHSRRISSHLAHQGWDQSHSHTLLHGPLTHLGSKNWMCHARMASIMMLTSLEFRYSLVSESIWHNE